MEKEKKDLIYKTVISGVILMAVLLGITYAYFTSGIQGDPSDVHGDTSKFIINLITENDGYINASELNLVKANEVAEKSEKGIFRVETGNNKNYVSYDLGLTSLSISSNLQVADFKWALINTDSNTTKASGSFSGVSGNKMTLATGIVIAANAVDNYELRIWIEETQADQISLLGGTFSGKVILEASMIYDPIGPSFADKILDQPCITGEIEELPMSTFANVEKGPGCIYKTPDDYTEVTGNMSYYFRGDHNLRNNVLFAGYQWKIVRIDGNGNIRMIYNGVCPTMDCAGVYNQSTNPTGINGSGAAKLASVINQEFNFNNNGETYFSLLGTNNAYVGYKRGGISGTTYEETHSNTTDSKMKEVVDTFYNSLSNEAKENIADVIYCGDRRSSTSPSGPLNNSGGFAKTVTYYAAYVNLKTNKLPSLQCVQENDKYILKAGLITADEVAFAGGVDGKDNSNYYLKTGLSYWTMSPSSFFAGYARETVVCSTGGICIDSIVSDKSSAVRPVIALISEVRISSGNGSIDSPYIVLN